MEELIPGHPKGYDLTLLNTYYIPPKDKDDDFILIIYIDNVKNKKFHHIIYNPEYTYYKLRDDIHINHHFDEIEKDKLEPITVRYRNLLHSIAENTNNLDFFFSNIRCGNYRRNKELHKLKEIFSSDRNINDYYRAKFSEFYKNDIIKISKAYMDIEIDIINGENDVNPIEYVESCPINAIAFLNKNTNTLYQLLLRDNLNPLIAEYEEYTKSTGFNKELSDFVIEHVGGYKKANKFKIDNLEYELLFFDNEISLIQTWFDIYKQCSPDFLMIYNMDFDLNYIYKRIEILGYDPLDFFTDDRIKEKVFRYYVDKNNYNDYEERGDFVTISGYTVWIDQMIQFPSRRKGRKKLDNYKLDTVAYSVCKINKLDYSHITNHIKYLPYKNYKIFSWYNIMDVIVQNCVEESVNDLDYLFAKCNLNDTRYEKCHRQSIYLANRFHKEYSKLNYILGNNINIYNEIPTTKYPGAQVGNPKNNSDKLKMKYNDAPVNIVENGVDFDYTALYPSIIEENNLTGSSQIGKIIINDKVHNKERPYMYTSGEDDSNYSRGGEFLENMMCDNKLEFYNRWFGLADIHELLIDIDECVSNGYSQFIPLDYNINDIIHDTNDNLINIIDKNNYNDYINILEFYDDYNKETISDILMNIRKG